MVEPDAVHRLGRPRPRWPTWSTSAGGCRTCWAAGTADGAGDRFAADPLGDDPKGAWQRESAAARAAVAAEGALDRAVTVSSGEISARDYLWQLTVDLAVHAWDLARAIGADEQLNHELVRRIHHETEQDTEMLAGSGLFDPPVHVPAHADLQAQDARPVRSPDLSDTAHSFVIRHSGCSR